MKKRIFILFLSVLVAILFLGKTNESASNQMYRNTPLLGEFVNDITILSKNTLYTYDKRITVSISRYEEKYRCQIDVKWLIIPNIRSNDIIGLFINSNINKITNIIFELNYVIDEISYANASASFKENVSGVSVIFKLPDGKITNMSAKLYFDIFIKDKKIELYGDYAASTKNVSSWEIKNHVMTARGIVLNSEVFNHYEDLPVISTSLNIK